MDDFNDNMDEFFTYSIISGEFDDDKKVSKRKEDSNRVEKTNDSPSKRAKRITTGRYMWLYASGYSSFFA